MYHNTRRNLMGALLIVCMIIELTRGTSYVKADTSVTTYYVGGDGASDSNVGAGPYATLAKAVDVINASDEPVNTVFVQGDTLETDEVDIHKDVTIIGNAVSGSAIITCPAINVWQDGSLTLGTSTAVSDQELIIDCVGNGSTYYGAVTNSGGYFILNYGVTIENNTRVGVNNFGTMIMTGGIIQDSKVGIINYKYLTMTGGVIRNNHSNFAGGGVVNMQDFTMNGGTICDNISDANGGGVYNFSSFHMGGNAVITGNSAVNGGGIYDDNSLSFAYGALYFGDDMTISGGTIRDNTAAAGGAVYAGSSFELSGSASIPAGVGRQNDVYLLDRLVVKSDWNFNDEIAFSAPLYCEGLQLLEINPALLAANLGSFYLENVKYDLTNEGKLTLHNKANVSVKYINGNTGDDITGNGSSLLPYATLGKAVTEIESTVDRTGIVYLQSDIELAGTVIIWGDITLLSQETHYITRKDLFTGCMVDVRGGLKLGVTNNSGDNQTPSIIFDGENDHGKTATGAILYNQGILDMYNGVIIQNNNRPVTNDWQLASVSNRNIFSMHGGMIRGNIGAVGGVFSNQTFRMEGSSCIQDNTGIFSDALGGYGYGGVCTSKYFCMSGGSIVNNTGDYAGGVYSSYYTGYFEMSGGEISGNRSLDQGGGVNNQGAFHMSGGIITGNQSGTGYSDGVYHSALLPLTLSGNAVITPDNGIGIDNSLKDNGEMSVTKIMINGALTGTLPGTNEPAIFKVNNADTSLGATVFSYGSNYHFTLEDSLRFIFNDAQPQEYGANADGILCPLLTGDNITIPRNDFIYNGRAQQLENIVVKYNDVILTENVDYNIVYSNNINVGNRAQVEIRGIGSYCGLYSEYFTIRPSYIYIQRIITANPVDQTFTAGQQMTIDRMRELLPGNVEVNTDSGIVTLPMIWNLSGAGEYNPKGGSYQFTGSLGNIPNFNISENKQFITSYTVNPSIPVNPEFARADIMKDTDKRATPYELGEALLPKTGYVVLEGYQLGYHITWDYTVLDTTDVTAHTKFIGTIKYINPPEWVTLPQDLKVSRTVSVYELMDETVKVNESEEIYQVRISRDEEHGSLTALYDITEAEILQSAKQPYDSLLSQLEIPISASERLLELINNEAFTDMKFSLVIPTYLLSDSQFCSVNIKLDPELLKAAKEIGKDITVTVKDESGREVYSWTFTGKNLSNSKKDITGVNLSLSVGKVIQNEELKELFIKDSSAADANLQGLVINFGHDGVLPSEAEVRVYIGDREDFKPGDRVYLYHVNAESGLLETLPYSSKYRVDKDGYITIHIVQGSEYIALPKKVADSIMVSLLNQMKVTPVSKTLYFRKGKNLKINIKLPETLELINSIKEKTSSGAFGAVKVTYRSSNTGVASVNQEGIITVKGTGKAIIYVKLILYSGKSKVVTIKINVKN